MAHDDYATRSQVFSKAAEFVSALSWEIGASAAVWEVGGLGWPDDLPLSAARPSIRTFPRIPHEGNLTGYDLVKIPWVKTEEQRIALGLFREARASNNPYLAFLLLLAGP